MQIIFLNILLVGAGIVLWLLIRALPRMEKEVLRQKGWFELWLTSELPGVKLYRQHMQKYFPKNEPNRYSLSGYFAAMLFTEGAKRAGKSLTRDSLIAALEGIRGFESGLLPPVSIGADHETQRQGFWVRVERGKFKQLTDWLRSD